MCAPNGGCCNGVTVASREAGLKCPPGSPSARSLELRVGDQPRIGALAADQPSVVMHCGQVVPVDLSRRCGIGGGALRPAVDREVLGDARITRLVHVPPRRHPELATDRSLEPGEVRRDPGVLVRLYLAVGRAADLARADGLARCELAHPPGHNVEDPVGVLPALT